MKRIVTMLLAAAFMFGTVAIGNAADFKTTGTFDFAFGWTDNTDFDEDGNSEDDFDARQRVRIQTVITASENVSGTLFFEIGETVWGQDSGDSLGGNLGTDGINIETRRAYIDFAIPSTALQIRMGLQGLALPAAVAGSPVLDDDVAAIVASYAFNDMYALTGFWARPTNLNTEDIGGGSDDEYDLTGLIFDVKADGFNLSPYFMFGWIGDDSGHPAGGDDTTTWWLGAAFELNLFDPFVFAADLIYGDQDGGDFESNDASGWFLATSLKYKMDLFTPGIIAWYGSGDDDDVATDGAGTLPIVSPAGFAPTSFGFDGAAGIMKDAILSDSGVGMWGVALLAEDIQFIEDVTHTVRIAYFQGTNDEEAATLNYKDGMLSDEDSGWEINFDTHYQIYENLAAAIELGWVKLDLEEDVWGDVDEEDAWKAGINLTYSF